MSTTTEAAFNGGRTEFRTLAESRAWTLQRPEPVLEPELRIVDAHHHFYDRPTGRYLLEELYDDIAGQNVTETVFVECESKYRTSGPPELRPVGETEFVASLGEESDRRSQGAKCRVAAAIVSHADLTLGERVDDVLAKHVDAGKGRLRGIRHRTMWDPHGTGMFGKHPPQYRPGLLLDGDFRKGYARLQKFALVFDAWLYFFQLPELIDLAKAHPDIVVVPNHLAGIIKVGPYTRANGNLDSNWLRYLRELASLPNVVMKVGGLGMTMYGFDFHSREIAPNSQELANVWKPYFDATIEIFGTDRCMLESNYPADQQSCSYRAIWNAFKILTRSFSVSEREALFWKNAKATYKF